MFAGSILLFLLKTSKLATTDLAISGPIIVGFFLALVVTRSHLVAVAVAELTGLLAVMVGEGVPDAGNSIALPPIFAQGIEFDPLAIIALGVPLLILVAGIGNT